MRFLSVDRRIALIEQRWGISVGKHILTDCYKRNGVTHRQAKVGTRLSIAKERALLTERIAFARKLLRWMQTNTPLIFFDETTFQIWVKPGKTW